MDYDAGAVRALVILPTYNEAENLPLLVPQVLDQDPGIEVLVVDDDSPDGTGQIADGLAKDDDRVHVLHRAAKEGLGRAYRAGFRRALELGADYVIQMDADFSHPPDALPELLGAMEAHDVAMGSRYLNGITVVNWPIERILISWAANRYARFVTGLPITDITGGLRAVRRELLEKIGFERIRSNGYGFQIEMNYRFVKHRARIKEIAFFFVDRTRGESKLNLGIAIEGLWICWWLRLADLLGRL